MPQRVLLNLEVREVHGEDVRSAYYDLRWRVLREPWTRSRKTAQDQRENESVHLGCWAGERLVGVGRLHFNSPAEGQIRFMAVEPGLEGQGIGSALLHELERYAAVAGARRVVLDARESARGFYERYGYQTVRPAGLLFEQIAHWKMTKPLVPTLKTRKSQSSASRSSLPLCDTPTPLPLRPAAQSRSNRRP